MISLLFQPWIWWLDDVSRLACSMNPSISSMFMFHKENTSSIYLFHTGGFLKGDAIVNSSADNLTGCIRDFRSTCVDFIRKDMIFEVSQRFSLSSESVKEKAHLLLKKEYKWNVTFWSWYGAERYRQSQKHGRTLKKIHPKYGSGPPSSAPAPLEAVYREYEYFYFGTSVFAKLRRITYNIDF